MVIAESVTDNPAVAPTERSSPPTTIVKVTPKPVIATTEVNFSIENNVFCILKEGSVEANQTNRINVTRMKPYLTMKSLRSNPVVAVVLPILISSYLRHFVDYFFF